MIYDWKNFLEIAKSLRDVGCEGSIRSGMSRTYYSLYGCALKFAVDNDIVNEQDILRLRGKMHGELPKKLNSMGNELLSEVAEELKTQRERRNDADYNSKCLDFKDTNLLNDSISSVKSAFYLMEEF